MVPGSWLLGCKDGGWENEDEHTFFAHLEGIADQAFDDQCTPANPRYPLITDLKNLYTAAYRGVQVKATIRRRMGICDLIGPR